jgi:hypothetical protein
MAADLAAASGASARDAAAGMARRRDGEGDTDARGRMFHYAHAFAPLYQPFITISRFVRHNDKSVRGCVRSLRGCQPVILLWSAFIHWGLV